MAAGAVVGEQLSRFLQSLLSGRKRIFFVTRAAGNPQIAHRARYHAFNSGRLIGGAESTPDYCCSVHDRKDRDREQCQKNRVPAFHLMHPLKTSAQLTRSVLNCIDSHLSALARASRDSEEKAVHALSLPSKISGGASAQRGGNFGEEFVMVRIFHLKDEDEALSSRHINALMLGRVVKIVRI